MTSYKREEIKLTVRNETIHQEVGDRSQLDWNRLGFKKLEKTVVTGRMRNAEVTIYFDKDDGLFGASICEMATVCSNYKSLIQALAKLLADRESLSFQRYIEIDYDRRHASRVYSISGRHFSGHEDDELPVIGLRLDFKVFDVSDPFEHHFNGGTATAHLWRLLDRNPKAKAGEDPWVQAQENISSADIDDKDGLIPYTEDRYRVLCEIQEGIRGIDHKLSSIFGERVSKKRRAELLDGFAGIKLLPAGEPRKKGRKK